MTAEDFGQQRDPQLDAAVETLLAELRKPNPDFQPTSIPALTPTPVQ